MEEKEFEELVTKVSESNGINREHVALTIKGIIAMGRTLRIVVGRIVKLLNDAQPIILEVYEKYIANQKTTEKRISRAGWSIDWDTRKKSQVLSNNVTFNRVFMTKKVIV